MSLNSIRADVRRDDLIREAKHARLAAGVSQPGVIRRSIARLHTGKSASPRRTYVPAAAER